MFIKINAVFSYKHHLHMKIIPDGQKELCLFCKVTMEAGKNGKQKKSIQVVVL